VDKTVFEGFLFHLKQDSIGVIQDSLVLNADFIYNRIKGEIAGAAWGKNEAANIRLRMDNQLLESIKHFHEADAFLKSLN
jgi:hypothetical protein